LPESDTRSNAGGVPRETAERKIIGRIDEQHLLLLDGDPQPIHHGVVQLVLA
jgi:hypothetical protein